MIPSALKRLLMLVPPVRDYVLRNRQTAAELAELRARTAPIPLGNFRPPAELPAMNGDEQALVDRFLDFYVGPWREDHERLNIGWLGCQTQKSPNDLWTYQELIVEQLPDVIFETGTRFGGSALFLATVCELIGKGQVVTIDVDDRPGRPQHPRITYIHGSSIDPAIFARARGHLPEDGKALVVLDSDHSQDHVRQELELYAPLIPVGGYIVVEDTIVNGHPTYPEHGPGPMEGLDDFLASCDDFVIDPARERFLMTCNPRGFLRRVR
ncbi:MAG: CmcI family methyltransferase [Pseudomonadota bacterium]